MSFGQDAGTSSPMAMSHRTAQPMGECWDSAGAGQHCRTNCALARAGPVPQNDPSFPPSHPKNSCAMKLSLTLPTVGQPAAACPPSVPLALPWAAAGSRQHPRAAVLMSLPLAWESSRCQVSPGSRGRQGCTVGRGMLPVLSTFPHRRELHRHHTAVLGLLRRPDEECEDIGVVRVESHQQVWGSRTFPSSSRVQGLGSPAKGWSGVCASGVPFPASVPALFPGPTASCRAAWSSGPSA